MKQEDNKIIMPIFGLVSLFKIKVLNLNPEPVPLYCVLYLDDIKTFILSTLTWMNELYIKRKQTKPILRPQRDLIKHSFTV